MHTRANAVSTTSQWYYKWSDKMRSSLPLLRAFWRIAIYAADVTYTIQWHSCIVHRKKKHNVCIYLLMCLPPVGRKTDVHCNTATEYAARCVRVYTGEGHAFQNAWLRYGVKKKNLDSVIYSKKSGNLCYYLLTIELRNIWKDN